jgi:protein kinase A
MDLSFCIWSREQTKVHQLLGTDYGGKYGKCHIINHVKTNEEGVMKVIWKAQMRKTHSGWRRVMNERLVWQKVSGHPYILSLKGFFETEASYCFVTHHIRDAVALNVVNKSAPLPEQVVKYLSGQLVIAINYLHHNGILHRSLSPECILVEKCGRVRLCDFENAKIAETSCHPFGDCAYMAPEIIQGKEYGKEADWWSFAIILLEMLLGNTPLDIYCDKKQITEESDISTEVLLRASESIPKQLTSINSMTARKLLRDFLTTIPEHRLGFKRNAYSDIKSHQFYKGLIWQKMESPEPIKEESD